MSQYDRPIGQIMSLDQAMTYFERCMAAEKAFGGPLTLEERRVILSTLGSPITADELKDLIYAKRVLVVKKGRKNND